MHAIAYFCGSRFGGWIIGRDRYARLDSAQLAADLDAMDEHAAGASQFLRRVVRV
jgi:hypothetical protein